MDKNIKKKKKRTDKDMRDKLLNECIVASNFALGRGRKVKSQYLQAISNYSKDQENESNLEKLAETHRSLSKLIWPVTPERAVSWDEEDDGLGFVKSGVPFMIVFKLKIVSLVSILFFIGMSMCYMVHRPLSYILEYAEWELLLTMLYYISAAGIGASFSILNKVNNHMKNKTFKDNHEHSYLIRFILGLISGLVMAMAIHDDYLIDKNNFVILNDRIIRPLLAIIGGFSAELLNTFLFRLIDTLKSLFLGSPQSFVDTEIENIKLKNEQSNFEKNILLNKKIRTIIDKHPKDVELKKELEELIKKNNK